MKYFIKKLLKYDNYKEKHRNEYEKFCIKNIFIEDDFNKKFLTLISGI
jgi:hypothetical protein